MEFEVPVLDRKVLASTFVELSTGLVDQVDVHDWLRCVLERGAHLLHVDAAAAMITEDGGAPTLVAATGTLGEMLATLQLRTGEGPCFDCVRTRSAVVCADLHNSGEEWPRFAQRACAAGVHAAHAFPVLRGKEPRENDQGGNELVGVLNFFRARPPRPLTDDEFEAAEALADLTAIGISRTRGANGSTPVRADHRTINGAAGAGRHR